MSLSGLVPLVVGQCKCTETTGFLYILFVPINTVENGITGAGSAGLQRLLQRRQVFFVIAPAPDRSVVQALAYLIVAR